MFRLAGLLIGSAFAVALILLVLGMPELPAPVEPEPAPIEPLQAVVDPPEPAPEIFAEEPEPEPGPEPEPALQEPEPPPLEPETVQWHAFWSPFGSRIAANGFVTRLESVTGFDYRVVKVDNGVFEVAFAYTNDAEREQKLSTIAAATGLDLPDS